MDDYSNNQLIEATEDDDFDDFNDETFGESTVFVKWSKQILWNINRKWL